VCSAKNPTAAALTYGNQRAYTTGGVTDWGALMQGVFQHLDAALRPDGQALVNLGLIHRENEWQPYWEAWLEWMRARLAPLWALHLGPGAGLAGRLEWSLGPSFRVGLLLQPHGAAGE
jgi:hypothetical protein